MPILSRKAARKPFKPPIQAKENIEKILGIESQKDKTAEIDNALNDSTVSSTSTDISNRLNEPAIKKLYMDFTVNLSKKILCSTPIPSSQGVKEEADLANMSFKDHMMNVISNSQPEPIVIAISDDELNKEDCETSLSQNIFNQDDLDFMKNFKKTKNVKNIFSSDEMGKRDDKIPAKSKKVEKKSIRKVCAGMPLEEITQNAQLKGDKAAEKPKKQGKPRVRKQKLSKANKNEVAMDEDLRKLISSEESDVLSASKETEQAVCENSLYDIGTVVWAKIDGYPWWPAMVDEDPDFDTHIWVEEHVKEPTWYHVTFFDTAQVTRAWVRPNRIRDYKNPIVTMEKLCPRMRSARLKGSLKQAENALEMSWSSRLAKYRFTVRYSKGVGDLERERKDKQKLDELKEKKRQERKERYLQKLKSKVTKTNREHNAIKKKKNNDLELYPTDVEEELEEFVSKMDIDMLSKGIMNGSFDMLEGTNQL